MITIMLEIGLTLLLIYLPFAAGGVTEISIVLLEVLVGLFFIGWGISLVFNPKTPVRHRQRRRKSSLPLLRSHQRTYWLHVSLPPALGALMVFALFTAMRLFPWPISIVEFLSSTTRELYAEAASNTFESLPFRLPFSVMTQASETELGKFVAYVLLFFVVINVIRTQAQLQRVLAILLTLGGVEGIYGLSQVGQPRIAGTFVNHNHFAGYLVMLLPLTFGLLLVQLEARSSSIGKRLFKWVDDKYLKTVLIGVLIGVMSLAIFLSGSRGGIMSFSVGMMCFCVLAYSRRLLRKWVRVILICVVLMFGMAVFMSPEILLQRLGALAKPTIDTSFQYRWNVWKNSLGIVRDFPLMGTGFGTFSHLFARYQKFPSDLMFTHAENDYLQVLVENGILGMGIIGWGIIVYGWTTFLAWRRQHSRWPIAIGVGGLSALVSMAIHSIVDFNLHIPSNAVVFTVIAALTHLVVHFERQEEDKADPPETKGTAGTFSPSFPSYACHTREICVSLSRIRLYAILIIGILLICGFAFWSIRTYAAFLSHQQFREAGEMVAQGYFSDDNFEAIISPAKQSLRYDANNADYYFALGSYLYQHAVRQNIRGEQEEARSALDKAEDWLKQAVLYDPANPWYYYELGRVSSYREDCKTSEEPSGFDSDVFWNACPTARYFWAALKNAPNNRFLRRVAGGWLYHFDHEVGFWVMRQIISMTMGDPHTAEDSDHKIVQFLYDMHLDYESDRWLYRLSQPFVEESLACQEPWILNRSADGTELEIGSDDGTEEWRVFLASEDARVKKTLCLPGNFDDYQKAALKIMMNHAGSENFVAQIALDDQIIKTYYRDLPRHRQWYEIPFETHLLQGKTHINVYIRVTDSSYHGKNYLQIWGDQDTPTTHSSMSYHQTNDLSEDRGTQTGEYMIRLVLRKE